MNVFGRIRFILWVINGSLSTLGSAQNMPESKICGNYQQAGPEGDVPVDLHLLEVTHIREFANCRVFRILLNSPRQGPNYIHKEDLKLLRESAMLKISNKTAGAR